MMRFPPLPSPASDAATPVRTRRVSGYFSSTAIATLVMLGATSIGGAQDWTGAVDSDYGTAGNWDNLTVPVAGDSVLVDVNVDVDVNAAFAADALQQDTATMTVGPTGSLTLTTGPGEALFRFGSALQIDAGGAFTANSMTVRNAATVAVDGTLTAPTEVLGTGSLNVNAGGTLAGDLLMAGVTPAVTIAQNGTLTGTATVNRGTLTNDGTIQGGLDTTGGNATVNVTIGATGTVDGAVTHGAGTLDSSGDLNGGLSVGNGVTANINAGGVSGGTTVGLGTLNIAAPASVDSVTLNGGAVNNDGTVTGAATVNGGTLTNDGTTAAITMSNGVVNNNTPGVVGGPVTVSGGVFNTTGTINDDVALSGGAFNAENAISGDITTTGGTFTTTGALTHTGNFINAGQVDVAGGDLDTSGTFTNDGGLTLSGADLDVTGAFTNTDQVILDDGRVLTAASVANNGGFIGLGAGSPGAISATIGAPVTGTVGSRLNLQNAVAGDEMIISGGVSGVNLLALDIDITTSNAGFADVLTVNGAVDGDLAITLNPITNNGALTLQSTPITLVDGSTLGGALNASLVGPLANNGLFLYRLTEDAGNGDINLQSDINPAIGGVAGAFSSVQSLVNTVVNRPSGAYVSGIAFDTPNNCSTGTWGRVTGGRTDADTTSTNNLGDRVTSRGSLNYGGFQGGADFGCFEAFDGGWDISGGVLAGYNQGEFDERAAGLLTSGDFDQYFVGGYVAAATGNWSGELQLRYANADFTFNNVDLDLRDESADVDSYSLSGSMTYRFDLREGLALLPTVGFAVTDNDAASLTFRDEAGNNLGRLKVDSHTTKTTFLGATLSQTTINEAAATATNAFVTGTYYFDNSGSRDSTFTSADGSATADLNTSEIGDFGEISVGGSYVQVLGTAPGQARQVNYGVRVDARFGDNVEGVGITGQVRLQF